MIASMKLRRRTMQLVCFLAGALTVAVTVVVVASLHELLCWKTPLERYHYRPIQPLSLISHIPSIPVTVSASSSSLNSSPSTSSRSWSSIVSTTPPSAGTTPSSFDLPSFVGVEDFERSCNYTIVIQTYKRNDILHKVLTHYCKFCDAHRILVVWNNVDQHVPEELSDKAKDCCPMLIFLEQKVNTIRNRFYPFPEIKTEGKQQKYDTCKRDAFWDIIIVGNGKQ